MQKTDGPTIVNIPLETAIVRGDNAMAQIQMRRPGASEMRGLQLLPLLQMDVNQLQTLLPRITIPPLTAHEVATMDPADLFSCGAEVSNFLLGKRTEEVSPPA